MRRTRRPPPPLAARPSVSVAVASYNYGHYLRDCVLSALTQEDVDVDVVIVDDGSTDHSVQVAKDLAATDQRVRLTVHDRNQGHIATFNEALWEAQGQFVVKLDSDDMLAPGSLARAARIMLAMPSVGLIYGNPLTFTVSPPSRPRMRVDSVSFWHGLDWLSIRCRRATNCIMQPEAMLRTAVLRQTDGHRRHLPLTHDLNLWLRIAAISDVARINGVDQGFYRVHSDSLLKTHFSRYYRDLVERKKAFDDFFQTLPSSAIEAATLTRLHKQNRRSLAIQALAQANRLIDDGAHDTDNIEDYVTFALNVYPMAQQLGQWRALKRRQSPRWQWEDRHWLAVGPRAMRSISDKVRSRRWQRFGT